MKNKLLKLFLFLIIGISSFARITNVSAVATSGDIITGKTVSGGPFYVVHNKGNGHRMWLTEKFIVRSSDWAFVYCVQPYVTIKQDNIYNVTTEDYASVLNISQDTWSTISKIAYYGYQYKDSTHGDSFKAAAYHSTSYNTHPSPTSPHECHAPLFPHRRAHKSHQHSW